MSGGRPGRTSRRRLLLCCAAITVLVSTAMAERAVAGNLPFYYGEITRVDPVKRVIRVQGDDKTMRRFRITAATEITKHVERPTKAAFEDLAVGRRVRILSDSAGTAAGPPAALRIFLYVD